jgi:hypothetical protein
VVPGPSEEVPAQAARRDPLGPRGAHARRRGQWFAAAKDAGLFDEAVALANQTPCKTLTSRRTGLEARRWARSDTGASVPRATRCGTCLHRQGRADELHPVRLPQRRIVRRHRVRLRDFPKELFHLARRRERNEDPSGPAAGVRPHLWHTSGANHGITRPQRQEFLPDFKLELALEMVCKIVRQLCGRGEQLRLSATDAERQCDASVRRRRRRAGRCRDRIVLS